MTQAAKADEVVFFIDQQKFTLEAGRRYTPRQLLELAGEDPAETTLVVRHGNDLTKLTNLDEPIEIKNGTHFVIFHNGPTPVS